MSNSIGVTVIIGGTLSASLIDEFISTVEEDIFELQEEYDEESLRSISGKEFIRFDGYASWGLCDKLTIFCENNNLSYEISSEADGKCDPDVTYWIPGMEDSKIYKTDNNNNAVIRVDAIKPITDLMCALITKDESVLPQFINDPETCDLVKIGLSDPDNFKEALTKKLNEILPQVSSSTIPVLIIDNRK